MNLNELEDLVVNELLNNNRLVKKIIMRKDVYEDFNKSLKPITRTPDETDKTNIVKSYVSKSEVDIEFSDTITEEYELVF